MKRSVHIKARIRNNKIRYKYLWMLCIVFLANSCLEPVDLNQIAQESILVVDAMITDQPVKQKVLLSRTVSLTSASTHNPERGARITLIDDDNIEIRFEEISPGTYETLNAFEALQDRQYHLEITTQDGESYVSDLSQIIPTPTIDSLYIEFEPYRSPTNLYAGFFNVYIDSKTNKAGHKYYRWKWNSTHEVRVTTPARWLWLGDQNYLLIEPSSENDSLQQEFCWSMDTIKTINIRNLLDGENEIQRQLIHRFHSDSGSMKIRYSILAKQYAISEDSYRYWKLIQESGGQGFLFDKQVGTITGNIRNIAKQETVLGYFEVVQEQSVRKFYVPADFHKDLYYELSYFAKDCLGDEPVVIEKSEVPTFMEENGFYYSLAYFVGFGPSYAVFLRKECTNCLLYADTNQKPDFW